MSALPLHDKDGRIKLIGYRTYVLDTASQVRDYQVIHS